MSMDGTALGNEIWAVIRPYLEWQDDETPPLTITGQEFWRLVGQKIVAHIVTNAVVTGTEPIHHTEHTLTVD